MTTAVVVAIDDFTLRIESDDPEVPTWLLHMAEAAQARGRLLFRKAIEDMMYGGPPSGWEEML